MFRTRKRPDEENGQQAGKVPPAPQELLAKEAAMAEKLLGDLIPEEPPAKKEPDQPKLGPLGPKPPEVTPAKPDERAMEPTPRPQSPLEKVPQKEEMPVEQKPVDAQPMVPPPVVDKPVKDDQLPEIVERVHALGVELVQIRTEILAVREKYTAKTKELGELQDKLKGLLGQLG